MGNYKRVFGDGKPVIGILAEFDALRDITDNDVAGKREIKLELKPDAYLLGLTHGEIARQIRQGFFGEEVQRLQIGTDEVKVWVRFDESDRARPYAWRWRD